jgi:hypothetical protein
MKIELPAVVLLALIMSGPARSATLTDAEATFLDQHVTASDASGNALGLGRYGKQDGDGNSGGSD